MKKLKTHKTRAVFSARNSICGVPMADLNQHVWWTDFSMGGHYLHVRHKDGETIWRVYCRSAERPRLMMERGKLMWLIP